MVLFVTFPAGPACSSSRRGAHPCRPFLPGQQRRRRASQRKGRSRRSAGGRGTCFGNRRAGRRGQLQGVAGGIPFEGDNARDRHRDGLEVHAVEAQRSHGDGDLHRHQQGQALTRLQDRREEDSAALARTLRDVADHVLEEGPLPLPLHCFRPGIGRHEGRLLGGCGHGHPHHPPPHPHTAPASTTVGSATTTVAVDMFDDVLPGSSLSLRGRFRRAWSRS